MWSCRRDVKHDGRRTFVPVAALSWAVVDMLSEILALGLLVFIAWFWFDSLRARERATRSGRKLCRNEQVQLLDETVALGRIWLGRDTSGRMQICRIYLFDYIGEDEERRQGMVATVGTSVTDAQLTRTMHDLV